MAVFHLMPSSPAWMEKELGRPHRCYLQMISIETEESFFEGGVGVAGFPCYIGRLHTQAQMGSTNLNPVGLKHVDAKLGEEGIWEGY